VNVNPRMNSYVEQCHCSSIIHCKSTNRCSIVMWKYVQESVHSCTVKYVNIHSCNYTWFVKQWNDGHCQWKNDLFRQVYMIECLLVDSRWFSFSSRSLIAFCYYAVIRCEIIHIERIDIDWPSSFCSSSLIRIHQQIIMWRHTTNLSD
jgi:hypothetical protein